MNQIQTLQGQAALVTGADSGIGKGVAIALAMAGAKVIINHVDAHIYNTGYIGFYHGSV